MLELLLLLLLLLIFVLEFTTIGRRENLLRISSFLSIFYVFVLFFFIRLWQTKKIEHENYLFDFFRPRPHTHETTFSTGIAGRIYTKNKT